MTVTGVLETALYVDDLERSSRFYRDLFGFDVLVANERMQALAVAGKHVLLLFKKGASKNHEIPHDGDGQDHMAFSIPVADLEAWKRRLAEHEIAIENLTQWERGGQSIYFRDPDHHSIELATPGTWAIY